MTTEIEVTPYEFYFFTEPEDYGIELTLVEAELLLKDFLLLVQA